MKKVYLLLTAICLTALTGCIKEEYTLEETAITVNVSTRATGTASTEQGDGIQDVNVWAFKYTETIEDALKNIGEDFTISYEGKDNETTVLKWKGKNETEAIEKVRITNAATAWSRVPAMEAWSSVDVHLQFMACTTTEKYILVAVINQGQFGTIKVGSETKTLGRYTTYSDLINAKFVAPAARGALMVSNPGNGSGADPDYMPISHWTTFDLTTAHAGNTHPNTCLEVPMPVYRALAKTQLLVAKSDANSTVTIKNVTLGSTAYPTEGALLSAAVGQVVTVNNTTKAADFKAPGDTTPQWYVSSVAKSSTTVEKDILTAESVTVDKPLTEDEHKAATADGDYTKFTPITSYFLYENKGGSDVWNTASTNGGYYMDVTYDAGAGDKTERVWLPAVVRNHDIQVRALVNAGGKMTLTINVMDWEPKANHWDFTDVVHVADGGQLKWIKGTEYDTNVNLDGNGGRTGEVECKFHIISPTGGTWIASLIGGDVNDFAFKVGDQLLPIVEGEISVEASAAATLTIVPKNPTVSSEKRVTLDIAVRTSDGRTIDASVVYGNAPRTIIQAKTGQ
ncbi:MAG: hypothetical protein II236_05565 [Alistipes sp.]|nr:hypothetical protein [Alistipes sp.]MBQ5921878.1 hypothetical protein [Alistipes sp.]